MRCIEAEELLAFVTLTLVADGGITVAMVLIMWVRSGSKVVVWVGAVYVVVEFIIVIVMHSRVAVTFIWCKREHIFSLVSTNTPIVPHSSTANTYERGFVGFTGQLCITNPLRLLSSLFIYVSSWRCDKNVKGYFIRYSPINLQMRGLDRFWTRPGAG